LTKNMIVFLVKKRPRRRRKSIEKSIQNRKPSIN
jgi:hypothetical protein